MLRTLRRYAVIVGLAASAGLAPLAIARAGDYETTDRLRRIEGYLEREAARPRADDLADRLERIEEYREMVAPAPPSRNLTAGDDPPPTAANAQPGGPTWDAQNPTQTAKGPTPASSGPTQRAPQPFIDSRPYAALAEQAPQYRDMVDQAAMRGASIPSAWPGTGGRRVGCAVRSRTARTASRGPCRCCPRRPRCTTTAAASTRATCRTR